MNGEIYRAPLLNGGGLVEWKNVAHARWLDCEWLSAIQLRRTERKLNLIRVVEWAINSIAGKEAYRSWCFKNDLDYDSDSTVMKFMEKHGNIREVENGGGR